MTYDVANPTIARLWPSSPSGPFEVSREFVTDIVTTRSGMEQRRALRNVPRLSVSFPTVPEMRSAEHFLRVWQNKPTAVADQSRWVRIAGSGVNSLTVASPPAWIASGQLLVLCGDTHELVEVTGVTGSTVSLLDLDGTWPAGSVLRPALFGLLSGQTRSSRFHREAGEIDISLDVYPGAEPPEDEGVGATFNGYEVLTTEPDWSGSPSVDYIWPVEQVDYRLGRTAQFRPIPLPATIMEAQFVLADPTPLEQFFLRMKGRRAAFYRSTGFKDFDFVSANSTSFVARGRAVYDDYLSFDFTEYPQAIELVQTDGTRLRRLVSGVALTGTDTWVTVNASWTVGTVARVSWLPLVRFASDRLTTKWEAQASISTTFQGVRA